MEHRHVYRSENDRVPGLSALSFHHRDSGLIRTLPKEPNCPCPLKGYLMTAVVSALTISSVFPL